MTNWVGRPEYCLEGARVLCGATSIMRQNFSDAEWQQLLRVPAVVFWAVALADGKADSNELWYFMEYVKRTDHADPLLAALFDQLAGSGEDALELSEREKAYRDFLVHIKGILERTLSPDQRRSFLAGLLSMGHRVADASGGFFGLGNRISAVESQRLTDVSELLGFPELN